MWGTPGAVTILGRIPKRRHRTKTYRWWEEGVSHGLYGKLGKIIQLRTGVGTKQYQREWEFSIRTVDRKATESNASIAEFCHRHWPQTLDTLSVKLAKLSLCIPISPSVDLKSRKEPLFSLKPLPMSSGAGKTSKFLGFNHRNWELAFYWTY